MQASRVVLGWIWWEYSSFSHIYQFDEPISGMQMKVGEFAYLCNTFLDMRATCKAVQDLWWVLGEAEEWNDFVSVLFFASLGMLPWRRRRSLRCDCRLDYVSLRIIPCKQTLKLCFWLPKGWNASLEGGSLCWFGENTAHFQALIGLTILFRACEWKLESLYTSIVHC